MNQIALAPGATPVVSLIDGHAVTTSQNVAAVFRKTHRSVLRSIRNLECSPEFRLRNFVQTIETRVNPKGGKSLQSPSFQLTKDGCIFLATGFTGSEAAKFKEGYIAEFNRMEAALRQPAADHHAEWRGHAMAVGLAVEREIYKTLIAGEPHPKAMAWLTPGRTDTLVADARAVDPCAFAVTWPQLIERVGNGEMSASATTAQLIELAQACMTRLKHRDTSRMAHQRKAA